MWRRLMVLFVLVLALGTLVPAAVQAAAVIPGVFNSNTLPGNDDGSTGLVPMGFSANFFGNTYTQLYVNNNGNVTFNSALGTYTPFGLGPVTLPIIAPFFADVDTRVGNIVSYGTGTFDSHNAFGVNWLDVGYYNRHVDKLNTFQLVLIERSDRNAGDFDIMFNYDQIQWETGDASGGSGGLGGTSAVAGFANGEGTFYQFPGSLVNGALLDGGPNALISSTNVGVDGRYVFEVINGTPVVIPLPPAVLLLGSGILGMAGLGAWRKFS